MKSSFNSYRLIMTRKQFATTNFLIPFLIWLVSAIIIFGNFNVTWLNIVIHILVWFFGVIAWRTLGQLFGCRTKLILYPWYFEIEMLFNLVRGKEVDVVLEKWKNAEINKF